MKRSTLSDGPFTAVGTGIAGTDYTDSTVQNGTLYYYQLTAVNSAGETPTPSQTSATPALPAITTQELVGPAIVIQVSDVQLTVKTSVPNRSYQLQRRSDLTAGVWQNIGSPQIGNGGDLLFLDAYDSAAPKNFYRVQLSTR